MNREEIITKSLLWAGIPMLALAILIAKFVDVFGFLLFLISTYMIGVGVSAYLDKWQPGRTNLVKIGLFFFGICSAILTVISVIDAIDLNRQYDIVWWTVAFQWPLELFYTFSSPETLFHLPFWAYLRILLVLFSLLLAFIAAKQFKPAYLHAFWLVLVLVFPPTLLIFAVLPTTMVGTVQRRLLMASKIFAAAAVFTAIGLFMALAFSSSSSVVYVVGARWIATDTPIGQALIFVGTIFFLVLGVIGIVLSILVAIGLIKPESAEKFLKFFS